MRQIKKILVANRGEIALRIMRTAREMNISTVAIFSEADRKSPHVRFADEAVCIGPAPSSESYLNAEKIINVCKALHVDAIHPGYGFLSENAEFASLVKKEGMIFIGPSPESIEIMGNKLAAKQAAARYNIPMVPGTDTAIGDRQAAKQKALEIGYPILIKASAGGGGKGMRIVENESGFDEQMDRAASEALASFGDSSVFIEKYITSPKHVEIQILGDQYGNIVHLFERECSVQRRHQKVIEEAPSVSITPETRAEMGICAINVAKSCGYYGAGTVEFIVDEQSRFYFLEMNTRLQVEHPVTELITGIDLVKQMILIAEGKQLTFTQDHITLKGHAIEARVYAEDVFNNFLPDVGTLHTYVKPDGNGIRVDDGFEQEMEIPIYYDPMIAKLIAYGENREEAIRKMTRAIDEYQISGVQTTLPFCRFVMTHPAFVNGSYDTNFVSAFFKPEMLKTALNTETSELAALLSAVILTGSESKKEPVETIHSDSGSRWKSRLYPRSLK
ncbi:acetyl-CoA carboxylase biotin carboxylase subunit [Dyadobacter sediminis]|uniref:Acetyl-CoA carboxylase biotin carboxylase subunit n=1 Tax=Dyadobacter sediminis TaxID=1493691 RepID=A0A5R9KDF7_9BACT|nr:acetyl-CoA carboxylase biotin carboxylase subunit [Dyadobacter sediminis]TLU94086.1 acetyl-CoA carboxylase biotin carboxylase subunit [Dyadobacter sediminis]GGB94355.1 acetyl-CoA carboxylase biotin carboxylase subunit [Dyadobacter sediminis]